MEPTPFFFRCVFFFSTVPKTLAYTGRDSPLEREGSLASAGYPFFPHAGISPPPSQDRKRNLKGLLMSDLCPNIPPCVTPLNVSSSPLLAGDPSQKTCHLPDALFSVERQLSGRQLGLLYVPPNLLSLRWSCFFRRLFFFPFLAGRISPFWLTASFIPDPLLLSVSLFSHRSRTSTPLAAGAPLFSLASRDFETFSGRGVSFLKVLILGFFKELRCVL